MAVIINNTELWIELAVSKDEARKSLMKSHSCAAADGYRMHIENENDACRCGDDAVHEGFDRLIETVKDTPFCFAINRKYLIDALSGINPDGRVVLFFVKPGGKSPVVIQDGEVIRTAIVMPMDGAEANYPKFRQQMVTPKKINQKNKHPKNKSQKVKS